MTTHTDDDLIQEFKRRLRPSENAKNPPMVGFDIWLNEEGLERHAEWLRTALSKAREAGEEDGFAASRLLWDRLDAWNKEWQEEKPTERSLTHADALKLIEWKIQREVIVERKRIESVFKKYVPPHKLSLEDATWLRRILEKAFPHE